jgi:glycosyltransferase involved in cell wall biosynthesis
MAVRNAHCLASLGFETHLCLGAGPESETTADLRKFYGLTHPPSLRIHRTSRQSRFACGKNSTSGPIFRTALRLGRSLLKNHQKTPIAFITREASFLPHLTWLVSRSRHRIRGYYEAHDFYADLSWRGKEGLPVKIQDRRQSWMERVFLPHLDGLIAITEAQRELYRRRFPGLSSVALPLGTEPFFEQKLKNFEARRQLRRAVYVGRLSRGKGLELLLRAAPKLTEAGVRIAFWGGNAEQSAKLAARAREAGATNGIECVSSRSPEELHQALANDASIGLVPLEDGFYNRYLTCPVKALDYLSHGLPAVATDLPSTREVLGNANAGVYVPPSDHTALTAAVLDILDDPERYQTAAKAACARAREISWSSRAQKIVDLVTAGADS